MRWKNSRFPVSTNKKLCGNNKMGSRLHTGFDYKFKFLLISPYYC